MLSIFFSIDGFSDLISIAELQPLLDFMANCGSGFIVLSNRKKLYKLMSKMANTHGLKKFIAFLKCISKLEKVRKESLADAMNFRKISSGHGQRMQVVMDYVLHHFHENITIKEVANLVFLTPNAFSRYFKQRTNKSFVAFLIEVRIAHACHLLIHSELSIGAIATAAGFSATSNFNKQFKVLKSCTPRAFKRARIHTT